jgi:hypothetical protein
MNANGQNLSLELRSLACGLESPVARGSVGFEKVNEKRTERDARPFSKYTSRSKTPSEILNNLLYKTSHSI